MGSPDTSVKYFRSDMLDAPVMSGIAGTLAAVLDMCLVDGFPAKSVASLVVSGGVATITTTSPHGLSMAGVTGPVISISGADQGELNAEWRIASTPSATTVTCIVDGVSDGSATGDMEIKRAASGWVRQFSEGHKRVYSRPAPLASSRVLRIDDSTQYSATVNTYESMTDIDSGVSPMPISESYAWCRSYNVLGNSTAVPWLIVADHQSVFMHVSYYANAYFVAQAFGDAVPVGIAIDLCPAFIAYGIVGPGGSRPSAGGSNTNLLGASSILFEGSAQGDFTPRFLLSKAAHLSTWGVTNSSCPYPDPINQSLLTVPVILYDNNVPRFKLPGVLCPLNHFNDTSHHLTVVDDLVAARTLLLCSGANNNGGVALDITGPFR